MSGPIIVAGGGTGGHVFVATAVADALLEEGETTASLCLVGSRRGQDALLLDGRGIEQISLPGRGIKRSLAPRALADNLGAVIEIVGAFVESLGIVRRKRPRCVVSVGGYAAAPVGLAAVVWRRPLILVNIDAVPGLTHRILQRFATAACVAFAGTPMERTVITGAPVRPEFQGIDRSPSRRREAKRALGVDPDRPMVAIVTGSLGARSVNTAVADLATRWSDRPATLYHVTGRRDFDLIQAHRASMRLELLDYRITDFEDQVPLVYQAADLAITRAGALTVAELALLGLPAVLVPLPGAPGDHQTKNAQALERAGGAIVLADSAVTGAALEDLVAPLLDDPERLAQMGERANSVGHPDAARDVARVVEEHAH